MSLPETAILAAQCALVVVDVQNDYCHDDGTFGRAGCDLTAVRAAVDRIVTLVDVARRASVPVEWVRTQHDDWTDSVMWRRRGVRRVGNVQTYFRVLDLASLERLWDATPA